MKRLVLETAALACAVSMNAQNKAALYDSTQVEALQEIVVKGVRAQKNAPFAIANIKKQELNAFSKTGKELPFLFSQTPGVVAWSENGLGTGTTYMRIRGAGDSTDSAWRRLINQRRWCFWWNNNPFISHSKSEGWGRGICFVWLV